MTGPKRSKDKVKGQERVEGQENVKGQELANVDLPASPSRTRRHDVELEDNVVNQDGNPLQHTISLYSDPASASMKLSVTLPVKLQIHSHPTVTEIKEIEVPLEYYMRYKYVLQSPTMLAQVNEQLKRSVNAQVHDKDLIIKTPVDNVLQQDSITHSVLQVIFYNSQGLRFQTVTGLDNINNCSMILNESDLARIHVLYSETIGSKMLAVVCHVNIISDVKDILSAFLTTNKIQEPQTDDQQSQGHSPDSQAYSQHPQVKYRQSKIDDQQPQGKYRQSTIDDQQPHGKYQQSTVDDQQPQAKYQDTTVDDQHPHVKYQESTVDDQQPQAKYQKSTVDDQQPQVKYQETTVDDQQPQVKYQESTVDDQQPQVKYQETTVDDQQPQAKYQQSAVDDQQPQVKYRESTVDDQQLQVKYQKTTVDDQQPQAKYQEIIFDDQQPQAKYQDTTVYDQQPQVKYKKSTVDDQQPHAKYQQSQSGDHQPEAKVLPVRHTMKINILWWKLLQRYQILERIKRNIGNINIYVSYVNSGDCNVIITGPEDDVKSATHMVNTWKQNMVFTKCNLHIKVMDIFFKSDICDVIEVELRCLNLHCVPILSESHELLIFAQDQEITKKAASFVSQMIREAMIDLPREWRKRVPTLTTQVESQYLNKVMISEDDNDNLYVTGLKNEVYEVANDITRILKEAANHQPQYLTRTITFGRDEAFLLLKSSKLLADMSRKYHVDMKHITQGTLQGFEMKGQSECVLKVENVLEEYAVKVKTQIIESSSATCVSYFGSKDGLDFVSKVQDECSVLIETSSIFKESGGSPDAQIMSKTDISMYRKEDRVTWRFPTGHQLVLYKQDISQSESMFVVTSIRQSNTGGVKTRKRIGVTKIDATIPLWIDKKLGESVEVFHSILTLAGEGNEDCVAFPLPRNRRAEDLTKCLVASIGRYFLSATENDRPKFAVIQTADSEIFTKANGWCEQSVAELTKDLSADVGPTRGSGIRVTVEFGSLSDSKADVLVNTASASLNLTHGAVSNALLKKAGSQLQDECTKTYPRGIKPGQVAMTAGYGLPCKHVFHGALDKYGGDLAECIIRLREFIMTCLRKTSELDLKTIAFPAIGTGILGYPTDIVAAEMFSCVERFQQQATRSSIQEVIFVEFGGDTTTVQIFKSFKKKMAAHEDTRTEATTDTQSQTSDKVVFKIIGIPEDTSKAKHVIADKISVLKKTLSTYSVEFPESLVSSLKRTKGLNGQPLTKELKGELDQYDVQMVDLDTHTELQSTAIASIQAARKHVSRLCADRKVPMDFKIPNNYQMDFAIEDVSELKYKLLCFFHMKTLQKCESDGVTIYYRNNDKVIVVSGKLEKVEVVQLAVQNILKDIITQLFTEVVALDNVGDVGNMVENVQRRCKNVYIDDFTKKNIVIYGEQKNDVTKAKKQILECFDLAANKKQSQGDVSIGDRPLIKLTARDRPFEGKVNLNQSHYDRQAGRNVSTGDTSKDRQTTSQREGQNTKAQQNAGTRQGASQRNSKHFSWSTDTRNAKVFRTREGIIIRVYEADILNLPVDCTVNMANSLLNHFTDIACIIATAAGQDLIREDEHVKANGSLNVGDALPTTAGQLRYRCVVHTVLPKWTSYSPHTTESVTRCEKDLYRAIRNSIVEADTNMVDSIAVPGIVSFGIPIEIYAGVYAEAFIAYSRQKESPSLKEIHVIDKDSQIIRAIQDTFDTMITKGMSNPRSLHRYTSTDLSSTRQTSNVKEIGGSFEVEKKQPFVPVYYEELGKTRQQNQLVCRYGTRHELIIYSGDILRLTSIDAIVCNEDTTGSANGMVAKLLIKDNQQYAREKADAFKRQAPTIGMVVTTKGGKLSFKWVLHALVPHIDAYEYDQRTWRRDLRKMIDTLLEEIATVQYRSVIMSLLGAGMSTNPQYCAEIFKYSYSAFCTKYPQLSCQVHLVNKYLSTTETVKHVFKRHIDELRRSQGTGGQSGSHSQGRSVSMSVAKRPENSDSGSRSSYSSDVSMPGATAMLPKQPGNSQSGSQSQYSSDVSMSGATSMLPKQPGDSQSGTRPNDSQNTDTRPGSAVRIHDICSHGPTSQTYTHSSQDGKGNMDGASFKDTKKDNCVICIDQMTNPKKLSCGHSFCTNCIDQQFTYKQACPTCGVITGDQPDGDMQVHYVSTSVAGYEQCGSIQITYTFRSGQQGPSHPQPGHTYKGITRTAYLPDNEEGQLVLAMLKVAFKRKVVFTIGSSRTTGHEGVITWNDIHHKTDHRQNTQFGYPDPTYLTRVRDELAAKGVTEADVK